MIGCNLQGLGNLIVHLGKCENSPELYQHDRHTSIASEMDPPTRLTFYSPI